MADANFIVGKRAQEMKTNKLWSQILIAIVAGIAFGYFWPGPGAAMKPLADAFHQSCKDDGGACLLLHDCRGPCRNE